MMVTCKLGEHGCWNDGKCRATSNCENKIVTNADRIRTMSNEELARFLLMEVSNEKCYGICHGSCTGNDCISGIVRWLNSEYKEK